MPSGKEGKNMDIEKRTKLRITENNHYDDAGRPKPKIEPKGIKAELDPYRPAPRMRTGIAKVSEGGYQWLEYFGRKVVDIDCHSTSCDPYGRDLIVILRLDNGGIISLNSSAPEFQWMLSAMGRATA